MNMKRLRMLRNIAIALVVATTINVVAPITVEAVQLSLGKKDSLELREKTEFEKFHDESIKIIDEIRSGIETEDIVKIRSSISDLLKKAKEYDQKISDESEKIKSRLWWNGLSGYEDSIEERKQIVKKLEKLANEIDEISKDGLNKKKLKEMSSKLEKVTGNPNNIEKPITQTLPNQKIKTEIKRIEKSKLSEKNQEYKIIDNNIDQKNLNEYLKETKETQITALIEEKIKEIGNNPLDIYHFVRNNIMFEPYAGSRKGATGTLELMSGNAYDQSSLLIALFRANNIPARYVEGIIDVAIEDLMKWTGAKTKETAISIMTNMGISSTMITDKGEIVGLRMKHIWVEAYISTNEYRGIGQIKNDNKWIPFDPSFKFVEKGETQDLSTKFKFDKTELLNTLNNIKTDESGKIIHADFDEALNLFENFEENIESSSELEEFIGKDMDDVLGGYKIVQEEIDLLPYTINNRLVTIERKIAEVESKNRDKVSIHLTDNFLGGELGYSTDAVDLYSKKITISWVGATKSDQDLIDEYGDILTAPANSIWAKPVLKIDGKIVATGDGAPIGQENLLQIRLKNVGVSDIISQNVLSAGGIYALGLNYGAISEKEILEAKDNIGALSKQRIKEDYYTDEVAGEVLNGIIKSYFMQTDVYEYLFAGQYDIANYKLLSCGIIGLDPTVTYLFGRPYSAELSRIYLDIDLVANSTISREGNKENTELFVKKAGVFGSMVEHGILEQLTGNSSVSTIKIMDEAMKQGIEIHELDKSNVDEILPQLDIDDFTKNDIKNNVKLGKVVQVPECDIQYYDWEGVGYIVTDESTGSTGYMISGGFAGGSLAFDLSIFDILSVISAFIEGFLGGIVESLIFAALVVVGGPIAGKILVGVCVVVGIVQVVSFIDDILSGELTSTQILCVLANMAGDFLSGGLVDGIGVKAKYNPVNKGLEEMGIKAPDDLVLNVISKTRNSDDAIKTIATMYEWGISLPNMYKFSNLNKSDMRKFGDIINKMDSGFKCEKFLDIIMDGIHSKNSVDDIVKSVKEACFTGDTLIKTTEGTVKIESVKPGDIVYSRDFKTNEIKQQKVIENVKTFVNDIVYISVKGKVIGATLNHPIYIKNRGYVLAGEIKKGDELILYEEDETAVVEEVEYKTYDDGVYVYNLELEDSENYLIGEFGLEVRAKCNLEVVMPGSKPGSYKKFKVKQYPLGNVAVLDDGTPKGKKVLLPINFDVNTGDLIKDANGKPIKTYDINDFKNKLKKIKNTSNGKKFAKENGFDSVDDMIKQYDLINKYLNRKDKLGKMQNGKFAGENAKGVKFNIYGNPIFEASEVLMSLELVNPANTGDKYTGVNKGTYALTRDIHLSAASKKVAKLYEENEVGFIKKYPELGKIIKSDPKILTLLKDGKNIPGYTWHHNHIPGEFKLVKSSIHGDARHTGGDSFWGGSDRIRDLDSSWGIKDINDIEFKEKNEK